MTNLTEKWKKGELKEFYGKPFYIKKQNGIVKVDYLGKYGFVNNYDVKSVLAEVPSFEQWQKHRKTLLKTQEKNCDLEIKNKQLKKWCEEFNALEVANENTKLKELLKKARDLIEQINWCESFYAYNDGLDEEIDKVLGEE